MGLGPFTSPLPYTITAVITFSFPSLTPTAFAKPLTTSPIPSLLSRTPPLLSLQTPPSLITTTWTLTSPTHPHLTPTITLTLTPLFRRQYRREQRVYPPLPSLRSARALPPIPSRRPAPYPSPDALGRSTCRRRLQRSHHPPLSNPTMYVGGRTRGLHKVVLSWILPTKLPTGGEIYLLSPLSHHRTPL